MSVSIFSNLSRDIEFNPDIAVKVGVRGAVFYRHICYEVYCNKVASRNLHDGRYWATCSVSKLSKLHPYMTPNQVRTALKKLVDSGLVLASKHNRSAMDQTVSYSPKEGATQ